MPVVRLPIVAADPSVPKGLRNSLSPVVKLPRDEAARSDEPVESVKLFSEVEIFPSESVGRNISNMRVVFVSSLGLE